MSDPARGPASRLAVLDGYRALAILAVIAFHYSVRWTPPRAAESAYPYGSALVPFQPFHYGWLGVEFFFMISGFVIVMTLERCDSVGDFLRRRLARLWPSMLVCATLTLAVVDLLGEPKEHVGGWSWLFSVLFVDPALPSRLLGIQAAWVDPVYWSLWVEVRFYLVAAVAFLLFGRRFLPGWLLFQCAVVAINLVALRLGGGAVKAVDLLLVPAYLPYFTMGIAFHAIFRSGRWGALPLAAIAVATAVAVLQAPTLFAIEEVGGIGPILLAHAAMLALFALFVRRSPLVAPFGRRGWARLGQASYSLYLLHMVAGVVLLRLLAAVLPPYAALAAVLALVIATALLLFRLVEEPAKRALLDATARPVAALARRWPWQRFATAPHGVPQRAAGAEAPQPSPLLPV
ncbi:MAG TPA: acyltransferase [Hyphomicrobiales bacterium]|nr:acyltransferase [Hyphomicrobiales bacterium]